MSRALPLELAAPRKRREPKPPTPGKVAKFRRACYGCGADLQMEEPGAAGYVEPDRYELKAAHKQLKLLLCCRCRSLSQGDILPAVIEGRLRTAEIASEPSDVSIIGSDSGDSPDDVEGSPRARGSGVTTPEELRAELALVRNTKCLAVLLVDVTDVTGSFLPRVRDLVAGNPIVLIGTKADLLPRGTQLADVEAWLAERLSPRLNVVAIHLVSARTGDGVGASVRTILGERKGRDIFIMGAANVGKSYFIGALLEEAFGGRGKRLPISSPTPGTTLRMIGIDCFDGSSKLFDTPGVHLPHRLSAQLLPAELKAILPRGKMRPYTPVTAAALAGSSFFWGGLARIDIVEAPPAMRLTFASAYTLRVTHCASTADAADLYTTEAGVTLTPPLNPASAAEMGGLELRKSFELDLEPMCQAGDISISGLGWVSVGALASLLDGRMHAKLDVWVPKGVEVSLRPAMPIGGLPNEMAP